MEEGFNANVLFVQDDDPVRLPESRQQLSDLEVQRTGGTSGLEPFFPLQLPGRCSDPPPLFFTSVAAIEGSGSSSLFSLKVCVFSRSRLRQRSVYHFNPADKLVH